MEEKKTIKREIEYKKNR